RQQQPPKSTLFPYTTLLRSSTRLKQHNRPEDKGGKDFWEKVCLVTSKDQNLTKSHIRYLEAELIELARSAAACHLQNTSMPTYGDRKSTRQNSSHVSISYAV